MARLTEITLRAFPWLRDAKELNPSSFTYEEHSLDNAFLCNWNTALEVELPEGWIVLGWCDGGKVTVRPQPLTVAVKFAHDDEVFWVHVA